MERIARGILGLIRETGSAVKKSEIGEEHGYLSSSVSSVIKG